MDEWIVVMVPDSIPNASSKTLMIGTIQFVVQEPLEEELEKKEPRKAKYGRGDKEGLVHNNLRNKKL